MFYRPRLSHSCSALSQFHGHVMDEVSRRREHAETHVRSSVSHPVVVATGTKGDCDYGAVRSGALLFWAVNADYGGDFSGLSRLYD